MSHNLNADFVAMYLLSYVSTFGEAMLLSAIAVFLEKDRELYDRLVRLMRKQDVEDNTQISSEALILIWEYFADFTPHDRLLSIVKRIGLNWWHPEEMSPLSYLAFHHDCLYYQVAPIVVKEINSSFVGKHISEIDRRHLLALSLRAFASYFIDNFKFEIDVAQIDKNRFLFDIVQNTLADNDDNRFMIFIGVLKGYCKWLTVNKDYPIVVNEKESTHNKIIIGFPDIS